MPETITANQLVAYNLMRARKALGLSQAEAAARIAPYLGAEWSTTVYSAAERSYAGRRVRQFSADDITAFALAFGLPVTYFWAPPPPGDRNGADGFTAGEHTVPWSGLFALLADASGALGSRMDELAATDMPDDIGLRALVRKPDEPIVRLTDLNAEVARIVQRDHADLIAKAEEAIRQTNEMHQAYETALAAIEAAGTERKDTE